MVLVNQWLDYLLRSLQSRPQEMWIYGLIAVLVMMEGPITILLASGVSTSGYLQPLYVFIAAMLGNTIADFLWYNLGYLGQIEWIERLPKFLRIDMQIISRLRSMVSRHAVKIIIIGKITNGIIIPVLIATGLARVPKRRWLPVVVAANVIVSAVYVFIGYHLTSNLVRIQNGIRYFAIFAALVFILAIWIYIRRLLTGQDLITDLENEKR